MQTLVKNVFGKRKKSSKDKGYTHVTAKVKGGKQETIFLKNLFSHVNIQYTIWKTHFQARMLKVILKVRKLGKIEWCHK